VQIFYSFNYNAQYTISPKHYSNIFSNYVQLDSSLQVPIKFALFPNGKNKVILRVENIGDKLDHSEQTAFVKIHDFAQSLWANLNEEFHILGAVNIEETTLSGNQRYSEAKAKKTKFVTEDDGTRTAPPEYPNDRANFEIAL